MMVWGWGKLGIPHRRMGALGLLWSIVLARWQREHFAVVPSRQRVADKGESVLRFQYGLWSYSWNSGEDFVGYCSSSGRESSFGFILCVLGGANLLRGLLIAM